MTHMNTYIIEDTMEALSSMREEVLYAAEQGSIIQLVAIYIELHERIMNQLLDEYKELEKQLLDEYKELEKQNKLNQQEHEI